VNIGLSWPEDLPSAGAEEYVIVFLSTRADLTAMPDLDDEHVIAITALNLHAGVATYLPLISRTNRYMPPYIEFKHPLLISHPKIYAYIKSSNSSAAASAKGFILFTYVLLDADLAIEALEAFR
jgi:hypothetical protein